MADVSANLLYYYKFDRNDISGNKLKNHATNNYDATLSSSSVISNRNYYIGNSSLDCQYGTMSVPLTLGASGFSFSFWLSATHHQNNFYFNSNFINLSHYNNYLRIYGVLDFAMANNGNSSTWMHIIITWSTANVITFYLNGKYNNTASSKTYPTVTNVVFSIYGGTYFFDDFRIYNYVISSQEDVNYLYYYPNYKSYINNLSNASLLSKFRSNFYDSNQSNVIFGYEPRNITPGTILLISGKSGVTTRNFGNYANAVTYSSISQAIFNSQYSLLYVIDNISGTISIINMQTGTINVVTTMDASSNAVENRYNLNVGIKSLAFDVSQNYFYLINGSYIQQMDYTTNMFIKNINSNALTSPQFCIIDSSNVLYISHATGIDKINLFAALPITTTNAITTATQISHMAISSMYPGKLFAVDGVSGKIYIITISTNAYFALTLPGAVNTSLCFDTLGNLYVSTNTRKIFLIPVRVFSQYSVDTTLARTGNYAGIYDYLDYAGTSGTGSTGDGGLAINATFNTISHIMMDAGNNMYISDSSNCTIRKVINKIRNTNYLNQITDEMGISSLYDISTLYSPRYNINANAATKYYVGTNSSGIDADIEATNFNWIDNSGLVLYYKFNTSGVNGVNIANYATGYPVFDASMSTSGLVNSTDFVLDNVALNISGGFVTINNSTLLAGINSTSIFNQGLSFAYWVRSNNTENYGRIFDFGNQASATYSINTYILNNLLNLNVKINGVTYTYDTSYSINNNIWYHICWTLTYSNANTSTYNVYVNGTIIYSITTGAYPSSAVTYPLCYIGRSTLSSTPGFNGAIDDFRMYTRVITSSEVLKLSNMGYRNEPLADFTTVGAVPTGAIGTINQGVVPGPPIIGTPDINSAVPGYYILGFTSTGSKEITVTQSTTIYYLVVAGGGAGGFDTGGGGGGGGVLQGSISLSGSDTITVNVGAGGTAVNQYVTVSGSNSSITFATNTANNKTAIGGGGGGAATIRGANGGSGGGGGWKNAGGTGTAGPPRQGYDGATNGDFGGGGGGAGANGSGFDGGIGVLATELGISNYYPTQYWGGGGGGTRTSGTGGNGGLGGGGGGGTNGIGGGSALNSGASATAIGGNGGANTGGGGGGGRQATMGGSGGSGIVVLAIPITNVTSLYTSFYLSDATPIKSGYYIASASNSDVGSGGIFEYPVNAFDNSANVWRTAQVYATNGSHTGSTTTTVEGTSFRGEWFQIQLPYLLKLTSYSLSNTTLDIYRLIGSTDGTTWYHIHTHDLVTQVVGNVTVTLSSYLNTTAQSWDYRRLNQSYYSYFRIIFSTATSLNSQRAQIGEFKLYGVGKYLQNNPTNNTFNLSIFDALPIMTNDTTIISNYVPSILNGTYIMSASSYLSNNSGYSPGKAFNGIITDFWNSNALYTSSGVYTGTVTTNTNIGTLSGEWIQIDMPYSLSLTGYSMLPRSSLLQFPKNWYLVGSNDGSNWYTIDVRSAITPTNAYLNYGNSYGNQNYYSKFRIVVISHGGNASTSGTVINEIEFSGIGKSLEYYENIYEFPSYNAVPPLSTASTTISGVMPFLLNGIYQASSSSEYSIDYSGVKAFVYNNNFWNSTFWNSGGAYNGSGTFIGTTVTSVRAPNLINVYGEWVQVKLPYALSITEYSMTPRSDFYKYQFPKSWYLVGSNDGTTWDAIDYQNYSTIVNQVYFSGNSYRNENYYSYLRIIVLNITSSGVVNGTAITTIRMQGRGRNL